MSDDWQVGDRAACVRGGHWDGPPSCTYPEEGAVYFVSGIHSFGPEVYLFVEGAPDNIDPDGHNWGPLWYADRFRKIRPDEPKACEEEFKILLKLSKKRVSA